MHPLMVHQAKCPVPSLPALWTSSLGGAFPPSKVGIALHRHRPSLLLRHVVTLMTLCAPALFGAVATGQTPPGAAAPSPSTDIAPAPSGTLEVRAVVVAADRSLRPVPRQRFVIIPDPQRQGLGQPSAAPQPFAVTTGFDGTLKLALPPGPYRIQTERPVELEGRRLSWDVAFDIGAGVTKVLELSNDNARTEGAAAAEPRAMEAAALYERFRGGVFKIISSHWPRVGFLVSEDGLILTTRLEQDDSRYFAKIDDLHKYEVAMLSADHNLAVLRIHPDAVLGRPVLPLADDRPERPTLSVGDAVVAIGSPLTPEAIPTSGVVSKVQGHVILSDVNINPRNWGGPLLDRRGQVVGVNTSGVTAGILGMTRIHSARSLLEAARERMKTAEPLPARPLPVEASYRFTPEAVKELALSVNRLQSDYHIEAGSMDVQIGTPVLIALQAPAALQDEEYLRPVVRIYVSSKVEARKGCGVHYYYGILGPDVKLLNFDRMELERNGKVVEAIHPGRINEIANSGPPEYLKHIIYWGNYEYPPEAFVPGATLILSVWEQGVPEPRRVPISNEVLAKIREDFKPYLETLDTPPPAGP